MIRILLLEIVPLQFLYYLVSRISESVGVSLDFGTPNVVNSLSPIIPT